MDITHYYTEYYRLLHKILDYYTEHYKLIQLEFYGENYT
jgi:hypothetical protein